MADEGKLIAAADLRAAVASGLMTEAQAAGLTAMANDRAGRRAALPSEDEPFEFFRGFSEIFVSVGLIILMVGISLALSWFAGPLILILMPAICAAIAWWWAGYFTLKRRMNLPSMVLAAAFGGGVHLSALTLFSQAGLPERSMFVLAALVAMVAMAAWFRKFRLPFTMFILGLYGLAALYGLTASVNAVSALGFGWSSAAFDLRNSPQFALSTLVFGMVAFGAGLWFDTRDPYRLSRLSATAFWLHMLAAPALVNTVATTLYNIGGAVGIAATAIALALIACLALIIDRRSFLTAGIVYIAMVISWIVRGGDQADSLGHWSTILIILGLFVTALGTWWVPLRTGLLKRLPDFPGKSRLPPYQSTE